MRRTFCVHGKEKRTAGKFKEKTSKVFLEEFIENYNLDFAERLDNISNEEIQDYDEEELIIESENDAFESDDFEDGNEFEFDFDDDLFDFGDDVEDEWIVFLLLQEKQVISK